MSLRRITVFAIVAVAGIGGALACGPFFPWQLLDDRAATLLEPPSGLGFIGQLRTLVAPPRGELKVVEFIDDEDDSKRRLEPRQVEEEEGKSDVWRALVTQPLSQGAYLTKLGNARAAATAEEAIVAGAGLPAAVLEYIAGAVAFNSGQFDSALAHFQVIDRLPPGQRRLREVAAAYMQARSQRQLGDFAAARTAFQAARARALAGAPDPMGLGLASLGEEARLDVLASGLVTGDGITPSYDDRAKAGALIAHAVELYAEQTERGSKIGRRSLRDVASLLAANDELLDKAIGSPIVRRLLVAYCIASDSQSEWEDAALAPREGVAAKLIDVLLAQPRPAADDVDRLAMLAYQTGRYETAEKLTVSAERALGLWVRAKLAFRRGDRTAAVRDLAAALKATATDLDEPARNRLRGELGVAQLSEGKYRDSMELLFPLATIYWGDVAYVAERVLTIDELKAFVDGLPDARKPVDPEAQDGWWFVGDPTVRLRELLARRLVRQGQLETALAYFPAATKDAPDVRAMAADYRAAVDAARPTWRWRNVSRAEAMFRVATLTRTQGMELMGTEGPPDQAALGGNFPDGVGQSGPWGHLWQPWSEHWAEYDKRPRMIDGWDSFVDPTEMVRVAASSPRPDKRFHYRAVAADRALEAAALMPQGSQAYAATLCWASRYAKEGGDQQRAWSIYQRYVATGAYQPWAKTFGSICPEPDFDAARDYWPKRLPHLARQHTALTVAGMAAVLLLVAGSILAIRRRRAA